jgi:uncharacterized membrane protein
VVVALVALFTIGWGGIAVLRYERFLTHAFDMGQMLQALWSIRHGGQISSVTGLPFLGDHARFILYPLAFLHLSARALLVGQALAIAMGAFPVYLLVRARAGAWPGAVTALVFLIYPTLQWTVLFDPRCSPPRSCCGPSGPCRPAGTGSTPARSPWHSRVARTLPSRSH